MTVPLLIGALFATFAPNTGKFFRSFTGGLFTGALPILTVFYVCMGATIDLHATPYVLKKGGALLVTKVGIGVLGEAPVVAVTAANPAHAAAGPATVLVAASVVVTAALVPLATSWWAGRVQAAAGGGAAARRDAVTTP